MVNTDRAEVEEPVDHKPAEDHRQAVAVARNIEPVADLVAPTVGLHANRSIPPAG